MTRSVREFGAKSKLRHGLETALALSILIGAAEAKAQTAAQLEEMTQIEIGKLEAERQKLRLEAIKGLQSGIAGSTSLTGAELTAEGLLLTHHLQRQAAKQLADKVAGWRAQSPNQSGPVLIMFGDQPPSIADYLAIKEGLGALGKNLDTAATQWRSASNGGSNKGINFGLGQLMLMEPISAGIAAVTAVASLFNVDTALAGAAVATPNEQFKTILLSELRARNIPVDPPRMIAGEPRFASQTLQSLKSSHAQAASAYQDYLATLARKGGKVENLSQAQVIAGSNLQTALADYQALRKSLYTPVNGILPAMLIDEQQALVEERAKRPILYIHNSKAALTSLTRKGLFTGLRGIPAYVAASMVVDYSLAGDRPASGAVTVSAPMMRISEVQAWIGQAQ